MTDNRSRRRISLAIVSLLGAGMILSASAATVGARPELPRLDAPSVEVSPVLDEFGANPTVSGNGQFVVFQGLPAPVAEGIAADQRATTIYLTDRATGVTAEVTTVPSGLRAGNSVYPVISGDGCSLAITTELALDVFHDDDTGDRWDIYRTTLPQCGGTSGSWELVSARADGSGIARDDVRSDQAVAVSRSGSLVAYVHPADHLVGADGIDTVSLVDLTVPFDAPTRTRFVAGMPNDIPSSTFTHVGMDQPAISGNGRYVAFRSDSTASAAVPLWGTGAGDGGAATQQVFVWDRQEADPFAAVRLVSVRPDGDPSTAGAAEPVLSDDGRVVGFTSSDPGLVPAVFAPCGDSCPTQVYRLDRDTDSNGWLDEPNRTSLTLVSAVAGSAPLVAGTAPSSQPALSSDGRLMAFVTRAANLQSIEARVGGGESDGDLLVSDVARGTLRRVTVAADGIRPVLGAHSHPDLSDTGRVTVFDSVVASEFVGADPRPGRSVVTLDAPPVLSLADADLGSTIVGLPSDEWYVAVINDGPSAFLPTTVTVSDKRFAINVEKSTCTFGISVPPGGNCTVWFNFTPSGPGPVSGTLTVSEQGFNASSVTSRVSGDGGEPALRGYPAGIDVGEIDFGSMSTEAVFDVENISMIPSSIGSIQVVGANAAEFIVTSNNCADRPLNPRANCSFGVTFVPAGAGRRTAVVEIATPAGQKTSVLVSGDGMYRPELTILTDEVVAGGQMLAAGTGYPPNSEVTIVFGDRSDNTVTTTTNNEGGFLLFVPIVSDEVGGERTIVVQSTSGAAATADIDLIADSDQMIGLPGFGLG